MDKRKVVRNNLPIALYITMWLTIFALNTNINYKAAEPLLDILCLINSAYLFILPLFSLLLLNALSQKRTAKLFSRIFWSLLWTVVFEIIFFLAIFHLREGRVFDWNEIILYREQMPLLLFQGYSYKFWLVFLALPLSIFCTLLFCSKVVGSYLKNIKNKNYFLKLGFLFFVINFIVILLSPSVARGELINFFEQNFGSRQQIRSTYRQEYLNHLNKVSASQPDLKKSNNKALGKNLFFIHLESLSSSLLSQEITPNYLNLAGEGVFFPKFYSNSVQTMRAQESLLCGLPPSPGKNLINTYSPNQLSKLNCLPKIFKNLGYKTIFFKSHDLNYTRTGEFMSAIGFDELHNEDIMRAEDPKYVWGFREDIFYQRALEYLQKNFTDDDKLFVYIAVSTTNHAPFDIYDERYLSGLPYQPYAKPPKFIQKFSNSTYLQDIYLGTLFKNEIFNKFRSESSVLVFGDHPWPIGQHGIYNEEKSFEENFLTTLVFLPPQNSNDFFLNKKVEERFSDMDIMPTLLSMLGIKNNLLLGNDFSSELKKITKFKGDQKKPIITMQPFSGLYIGIINYPNKYLFNILENKFYRFNIQKDPLEEQSLTLDNPRDKIYLINNYFEGKKDNLVKNNSD